jgi:probable phosphoglycerate mutase
LRLLLIRHAEPAYPRDALTAEGRRQARALAARLAAGGLAGLYSSPMRRALATAEPVAEASGVGVRVEPWLGELESWAIDLPARGEAPAWEVAAEAVRAGRPPLDADNWPALPALAGAGLGERFAELARRSDEFLAGLGYRREGGGYRTAEAEAAAAVPLAVVCHEGLILTWLAHLLAIPPPLVWAGFSLPPASVTTVVFEPVRPGWAAPRCRGLADVAHLTDFDARAREGEAPGGAAAPGAPPPPGSPPR